MTGKLANQLNNQGIDPNDGNNDVEQVVMRLLCSKHNMYLSSHQPVE